MVPWAMPFASGSAFNYGMAALLIAALWILRHADRPESRDRWSGPLFLVGAIVIALSSTPVSLALDGLLVVSALPVAGALLIPRTWKLRPGSDLLAAACCALLVCWVVTAAAEYRATRIDWPSAARADWPIYVIGDSLSASETDPHLTTWPQQLARKGLSVTNLARMGATERSALQQLRQIPTGPAIVLLLIGGNDILGAATPETFEADLRELLRQAASGPDRLLILFELPLPPGGRRFGAIQRRCSAEAGARLVSKRLLGAVLGRSAHTVDGIHLSQAGHDALAAALLKALPRLGAASVSALRQGFTRQMAWRRPRPRAVHDVPPGCRFSRMNG